MPNPNTMASDDEVNDMVANLEAVQRGIDAEKAARAAKRLSNSKLFIELLYDAGYEPVSYSGRGMYGKSCVSVHSDERGTEFLWNLSEAINTDERVTDTPYLQVSSPSSDSLGLGMVYYWPSFPWPEDAE